MITDGGLANLPPTLVEAPTLLYTNNNDRTVHTDLAGRRLSAEGVLRMASPALPQDKQWKAFKCDTKTIHAKLLLLRFGPEGDEDGFLRVCIGSANLYTQWGHSRGTCSPLPPTPLPSFSSRSTTCIPHITQTQNIDVLWVQDFPVTAAPQHPLPPLHDDRQPLRHTLRYFLGALFKLMSIQDRLEPRLAACLAAADLSDARATALVSMPLSNKDLPTGWNAADWNGLQGLGTALGMVAWPQTPEAQAAPVTCMSGSLGDPTNGPWRDDLTNEMSGRGAHGALSSTLGLRIMYPTNYIASRCVCVVGGCACMTIFHALNSTHDSIHPTTDPTLWSLPASPTADRKSVV